jgi:thiol-disulfide isomerase/thioredoxin
MPHSASYFTTSTLSWALLCIMIASTGLLIRQNRQLRAEIAELVSEQRVQVGESFSDFESVDLNNKPTTINSIGKARTLLLFFDTKCPYCKKQNSHWTELLKHVDSRSYEVYALFKGREDRARAKDYLKEYGYNDVGVPLTVLFSDEAILERHKLRSTPNTLVLNEHGVVEKVWPGLWSSSIKTEVDSFFSTSLH